METGKSSGLAKEKKFYKQQLNIRDPLYTRNKLTGGSASIALGFLPRLLVDEWTLARTVNEAFTALESVIEEYQKLGPVERKESAVDIPTCVRQIFNTMSSYTDATILTICLRFLTLLFEDHAMLFVGCADLVIPRLATYLDDKRPIMRIDGIKCLGALVSRLPMLSMEEQLMTWATESNVIFYESRLKLIALSMLQLHREMKQSSNSTTSFVASSSSSGKNNDQKNNDEKQVKMAQLAAVSNASRKVILQVFPSVVSLPSHDHLLAMDADADIVMSAALDVVAAASIVLCPTLENTTSVRKTSPQRRRGSYDLGLSEMLRGVFATNGSSTTTKTTPSSSSCLTTPTKSPRKTISDDVFLRFFQLVLSDDAAEFRVGPTLQKEIIRRANEKSLPSLKGDPNLHALADELLMYEGINLPPPSISENSVETPSSTRGYASPKSFYRPNFGIVDRVKNGGSSSGSGGSGLPSNKSSPEANATTGTTPIPHYPSHPLSGVRIEDGATNEENDEKRGEEGNHALMDRSKLKNLKKARSRGSVLTSSFANSGFSAGGSSLEHIDIEDYHSVGSYDQIDDDISYRQHSQVHEDNDDEEDNDEDDGMMYYTPSDRSSPRIIEGLSNKHSPSSSSSSAHRSLGRRGIRQGQGQGLGVQGGQGLGTTRPRIFFPPTPTHHDNDNDGSGKGGVGGVGNGKGYDGGVGETRKENASGLGTGIGGGSSVKSISANVRRGRRVRSTYDATTTSPSIEASSSSAHPHHDMSLGNGTMTMAISSAPSSYYILPKASIPAGSHPGSAQSNPQSNSQSNLLLVPSQISH